MSDRKMTLRILIRTPEGKQQEFTLAAVVKNPDIQLGSVAYNIERAINEHTSYRAHSSIEEA